MLFRFYKFSVYFRCGVVSIDAKGYELKSDLTKPYPDCCQKPVKISTK